ncbi:plasmid encoded RepA protein [Cyanosarcina cf. burmensis CCALA 770]|nr:plasmid encoded RepA protein [Cyanosarcina cf. burmensis CCALA 770]
MNLTRQQHKILEAGAEIFSDRPTSEDTAWMARQLVQATLPHSDPGDVPAWGRTNGNLTLTIKPAWDFDPKTNESKCVGVPYGTIPRLLLFWLTTEAIRVKNRRIELGSSLTDFMFEIGLNPNNGGTGAKRSDARRLKDQMERLFRSTISFDYSTVNSSGWLDMQIAPEGFLWWDEKNPDQGCLFDSWIELGEKFYQSIISSPVPIDLRALRALKKSPLALDIYGWATYVTYSVNNSRKPRCVSWDLLHQQFGSDYKRICDFRTKALAALKKIKVVYPDLHTENIKGGVKILPSTTAVLSKSSANLKKIPSKQKLETSFVTADLLKELGAAAEISAKAYEKAKQLALDAGTDWDIRELERQFQAYANKKGRPTSPDRAFLGFVRKKIQKRP